MYLHVPGTFVFGEHNVQGSQSDIPSRSLPQLGTDSIPSVDDARNFHP